MQMQTRKKSMAVLNALGLYLIDKSFFNLDRLKDERIYSQK